jgi:L-aspartate semialdehyde sulfurtransferase ferredoxin
MKETRRFWLTVPSKIVKRPIIWELGHKFKLVTNIGQASVTSELGIVSLSVEGQRAEIKKAITWLEKLGVKVEPVEINTIEG